MRESWRLGALPEAPACPLDAAFSIGRAECQTACNIDPRSGVLVWEVVNAAAKKLQQARAEPKRLEAEPAERPKRRPSRGRDPASS